MTPARLWDDLVAESDIRRVVRNPAHALASPRVTDIINTPSVVMKGEATGASDVELRSVMWGKALNSAA